MAQFIPRFDHADPSPPRGSTAPIASFDNNLSKHLTATEGITRSYASNQAPVQGESRGFFFRKQP